MGRCWRRAEVYLALSFGLLVVWSAYVAVSDARRTGEGDCGRAAVSKLLELRGVSPELQDMVGSRISVNGPQYMHDLVDACRSCGISSEVLRLSDPVGASFPYVAWLSRGHYVVVESARGGALLVFDPDFHGARYWSNERFEAEFGGYAIIVKTTNGAFLPL